MLCNSPELQEGAESNTGSSRGSPRGEETGLTAQITNLQATNLINIINRGRATISPTS
jgi:hypothetical protein